MRTLKRIYIFIRRKYTRIQILILLIVIAFGFFITDTSLFTRCSSDARIMELNNQIEFYREKTEEDHKKLNEINEEKEHVEEFARENYKMKKPNEDVYIVE